jgi:hypothetical protein
MARLIRMTSAAFLLPLLSGQIQAANDSLYFLYQRTTYLENLWTPGGWWANPALIGELSAPSAYTINTTPLGYRYTLASVKYVFPFFDRFGAGFGIMGTGISDAAQQSGQASSSGVTYNSHFTFSNPSFQSAIGGSLPKIGSGGALIDIGAEMLPNGFGGSSEFLLTRLGLGILTPFYFNSISASATATATMHFWNSVYIDWNAKLGLRIKALDSLLTGTAEYTLTFQAGSVESFYTSSSYDYEVFKTMMSVRFYKIFGFLIGYSTDFGEFSNFRNGSCIHLGMELRASHANPIFAGYDLGISIDALSQSQGLLIHRLWIGYRFLAKKPENKDATQATSK